MIPKILHVVWVGDESRRPDGCIDTWREFNPDFEVRVWGNEEWHGTTWRTAPQMREFERLGDYPGVADLMRYEILHREGGFTLDADAVCVRPLPDWLLEPTAFAVWENEVMRPGLIANGYLGAVPGLDFYDALVDRMTTIPPLKWEAAWNTTGPVPYTDFVRERREMLTIYPSHYFMPRHYTGYAYRGDGPVFGTQLWASTFKADSTAHDLVEMARADIAAPAPPATELEDPWDDYHGPPGPTLTERAVAKAKRITGRVTGMVRDVAPKIGRG